ncbi:MAG: hypothetical protein ACI9SK_000933 [Zhongshania sp.]|jgi:hypothetical protein
MEKKEHCMSEIEIIQQDLHAAYRCRQHRDYCFTASQIVAPISVAEFSAAALALPIVFSRNEQEYSPVMLQGVEAGVNLMVGAKGKWVGRYTPASYRAFPFMMGLGKNDQQLLCFRQNSDYISDVLADEDSFPLFEDGQPSEAMNNILKMLNAMFVDNQKTKVFCAKLAELGLLSEWSFTLCVEDKNQPFTGFFAVDENKLRALSDTQVLELNNMAAIPAIYAHLISLQNTTVLGRLNQLRTQQLNAASEYSAEKTPDFPISEDQSIDLDWL